MKLTGIHIKNFKAIHEMKIDSIENALILVGQNNTGKTTILEAIRAAFGDYHISGIRCYLFLINTMVNVLKNISKQGFLLP